MYTVKELEEKNENLETVLKTKKEDFSGEFNNIKRRIQKNKKRITKVKKEAEVKKAK